MQSRDVHSQRRSGPYGGRCCAAIGCSRRRTPVEALPPLLGESIPIITFCRRSMFVSWAARPLDDHRPSVFQRAGTLPRHCGSWTRTESPWPSSQSARRASGLTTRVSRSGLARSCNEFAAQMAVDHPQRFGFFAALPLPDVKASLSELGHAVETLKCDGVGLMTNYGDRYLGDAGFRPVFEEINRRGLIVHVHPYTCSCDLDVLPGIPSAMIEFPHSTTRTIVSLLASDAFNRWPNIRFIFSHAGGTIPFLVNRVDGLASAMAKQGWVDQLRKLHYDTAGPPMWPRLAHSSSW